MAFMLGFFQLGSEITDGTNSLMGERGNVLKGGKKT